jgi:hypothetical protein
VPAWHPAPPPDPLIALGGDPARPMLAVAAFLGEMTAAWGDDPAGRAALEALLGRLAGWSGRARHDIRLRPGPQGLALTVEAAAGGGPPPAAMSAALVWPDGGAQAVVLSAGAVPGRFEGLIPAGGQGAGDRALLLLSEPGRPAERIPIVLPPGPPPAAPAAAEPFHSGIDRPRLAALAAATGGAWLDPGTPSPPLDALPPAAPALPAHPWWLAAAAVLFALSLWLGGARAGGRPGRGEP